jgi:hypothetical protein
MKLSGALASKMRIEQPVGFHHAYDVRLCKLQVQVHTPHAESVEPLAEHHSTRLAWQVLAVIVEGIAVRRAVNEKPWNSATRDEAPVTE